MTVAARYAAQIEADRQAHIARPKYEAPTCFSCGRGFAYKGPQGDDSGRFCSARCREWYDAGNPAYEPLDTDRFYSLPKGPTGFYINCAGCQKRFDSRGLRCCSPECERTYRQRGDNAAVMAEVGMTAATKKRPCQAPGCTHTIPLWRKGRKVSKATRFCSDKCSAKARRGMESPYGILSPETAKKCPENGPQIEGAA